VHNSVDDMGTYISCGNIGGHDVNGTFLVGMGPVGDSPFSGIANITDNGDGTSAVTVSITQFGPAGMMGEMMDDDMSEDMDDDMSEDMDDDDTDA
jgi:hypothetical protein